MKIEKLFARESTNETELDLNLYYDRELKKLVYRDRYGIRTEISTGSGGSSTSTDINTIFVSPNGDDANDGSINNPVKSLIVAKNLANSGDLVYVFPGKWVFDNRNSAGNPYNVDQNNKLNLWKNGVSYYFSPGTAIQFINQTVTGNIMALFRPVGNLYETCKVYGKLDFTSNSEGADTFNGRAVFFQTNPINNNFGYEFNAEVRSLISNSAEVICAEGTTITDGGAQPNTITIKADLVQKYYLSGQSGAGSVLLVDDSNKSICNFDIVKFNGFQNVTNFSLSNGVRIQSGLQGTTLNLNIDTANVRSELLWLRSAELVANINVNQAYLGDRLLILDSVGAGTINIEGNYNITATSTPNVMDIGGGGKSVVNFKGNISTNATSGNGKTIINLSVANNTCIFTGNVNYLGVANTINPIISNSGTVTFSGNITGSFNGSICGNNLAGAITTLQNVRAKLNTSDSRISNSGFGTTVISNCSLILGGSTGIYSTQNDVFVTNSSIKSSSLGFLNTSGTGSLNLINSAVITGSTNPAVNFTGAAPVNIANSSSNNAVSAVTLNGAITTVTNLNIA